MGIFMNTRHSGTESGHVTAELEALTNEATFGAGNYVFEAGNKFSITVTPVTGDVNISNGVFCWCGRLGGVDAFASVKYTPPGSETLYKKIIIGAKYTKNSASLVESISLAAVESEIQASESAAAGVTLDFDSAEIKPDTVSAFFPLWEFIANSKSYSTPVKLFDTVNNLSFLLNRTSELQTAINQEVKNRTNADSIINTHINALERKCELIHDVEVGNGVKVTFDDLSKYVFLVAMTQLENDSAELTPYIVPVVDGDYYFRKYTFNKPTVGSWEIKELYNQITITGNEFLFRNSSIGKVMLIYGVT